MEIVNKLTPIAIPPKDHCGWYGLVIKPKYIPLWLAKIFKNHLRIYEGWYPWTWEVKDPNGKYKISK